MYHDISLIEMLEKSKKKFYNRMRTFHSYWVRLKCNEFYAKILKSEKGIKGMFDQDVPDSFKFEW